jgi:hypothetical protein
MRRHDLAEVTCCPGAVESSGSPGPRPSREEPSYLAVDDHGVQALLAAEVLVDDRLGHPGAGGDLLDRGAVEPALGEEAA